ncbi:L-2-amino-thiazoline-4-carboxylic acid hydrolase [Planctomycetota bacterium]
MLRLRRLYDRVLLQISTAPVAVRILLAHVGGPGLLGLFLALLARQCRGEPWSKLTPPASETERECRDQIGQAILLYDALRDRVERELALKITGEIVREAAVLHLRSLLPPIRRARYQAMSRAKRTAMLNGMVARFPNATVTDLVVRDDVFSYRVTRCELVALARRLGRAELAPLFCSGDSLYFERYLKEVDFQRPGTIALGAESCDFCFRWSAC